MKKTTKRLSLLVTLICAFVFVLSLGILSACGNTDDNGQSGSNVEAPAASGKWYYGSSIPADELGQDGDYYLNTETLSSYVKEGKVWRAAMPQEMGKWLYGEGTPQGTTGEANDFYLDVKNGDLYHKDSAKGWESILQLFGKNGRDGVMWFSGDKAPQKGDAALAEALPGDFYLYYPTFEVYQLGVDKEWHSLGSLKGDKAQRGTIWFTGTFDTNSEDALFPDLQEGDFYFRTFSDLSDKTGYEIYHYSGKAWHLLVDASSTKTTDPEAPEKKTDYYLTDLNSIHEFIETVKGGNDYEGKKIHISVNGEFDLGKELVTVPQIKGNIFIEGGDKASSILQRHARSRRALSRRKTSPSRRRLVAVQARKITSFSMSTQAKVLP